MAGRAIVDPSRTAELDEVRCEACLQLRSRAADRRPDQVLLQVLEVRDEIGRSVHGRTASHCPATIAAMCELLAVRADEPFELAVLWGLAEGLERYGLAGYGWGVAWVRSDGALERYRATSAFRDDERREEIGRTETTSALVHLRRPSRFSWLGMADTQPFLDGAGRFAFAHNGELARHRRLRAGYREAGRIHGKADSEVGMRWLEDAWAPGGPAGDRLLALQDALGGTANLAVLEPGGAVTLHAGNAENPVFGFRLGDLRVLATGIYSLDRSLFRLVAPGARERRLVARGCSATL
jgi:hypothetical protein